MGYLKITGGNSHVHECTWSDKQVEYNNIKIWNVLTYLKLPYLNLYEYACPKFEPPISVFYEQLGKVQMPKHTSTGVHAVTQLYIYIYLFFTYGKIRRYGALWPLTSSSCGGFWGPSGLCKVGVIYFKICFCPGKSIDIWLIYDVFKIWHYGPPKPPILFEKNLGKLQTNYLSQLITMPNFIFLKLNFSGFCDWIQKYLQICHDHKKCSNLKITE